MLRAVESMAKVLGRGYIATRRFNRCHECVSKEVIIIQVNPIIAPGCFHGARHPRTSERIASIPAGARAERLARLAPGRTGRADSGYASGIPLIQEEAMSGLALEQVQCGLAFRTHLHDSAAPPTAGSPSIRRDRSIDAR